MSVEKLSVSLDGTLLDFVAQYQKSHQVRSKSEVVARALTLLREHELEGQYAGALEEWHTSGDAERWDALPAVDPGGDPDAAR
ncbi:type II toxin-antitoxin system ParD family antitoxin [Deinococcus sedimenti]|uniref:Antitoxin n=1 Tax=Deinococcus sedimenti TaxID=1867090 RepID=A0ABQ2S8N2_9DEIO|nr:type II toxin-antitoxin system ParD family antitoxin [Deinococcus sedimenti]GGS05495.1 hypothetical protein GCM10008960_34980 [Deinococcus sedimenti]